MYIFAKHLHLTLVITSVSLFTLRFILLSAQSQIMQQRLLKVLPHIIDTFLLLSAIWLCLQIEQYPLTDAWLSQKLMAVILYIAFGYYTLKKARNLPERFLGLGLAVLSLSVAAHTAMTKTVLFFN